MRRSDRAVTTPDILWLMIEEGLVMHLALLDPNDKLYATCVHYGFIREKNLIYFHGAMKGRKAETLTVHPDAAFQIIGRTEMVPRPNKPGYFLGIYRSVIGSGKVRVVADLEEKRLAIRRIHEHYHDAADDYEISDTKLEKVVNVFSLEITELTGKIKGYPNPDKPEAKVVIKDW